MDRKVIGFGKFAVDGKRRVNEVTVEVKYGKRNNGYLTFSVMGSVWNSSHTDLLMGGQCLDEINDILAHSGIEKEKYDLWKDIYGLWKRNHLNDLRPYANHAQRDAVNDWVAAGNKYDYTKVCDHLKEIGLYEVEVNGRKCAYGAEWYYEGISKEDQNLIAKVMA